MKIVREQDNVIWLSLPLLGVSGSIALIVLIMFCFILRYVKRNIHNEIFVFAIFVHIIKLWHIVRDI